MEQDDLKATELDRMTSSHELQMLKAALSYFPAGPRRLLSLVIKARELKNTVELFSSPDALSICSVSGQRGFFEALSEIKEYGSPEEKRSFERLETMIQLLSLYRQSQSPTEPGGEELSAARVSSQADFREYVRKGLSEEEQSLFDSYIEAFRNKKPISEKEKNQP